MEILFLCTGNTCRSPMAAGLFALQCSQRGLHFGIRSAGLAADIGSPAAPNAVQAAAQLGADISAHRAQQATPALLQKADYIVCMSAGHARSAASHAPPERIRLLGGGVADPYGGSPEVYQGCAQQIDTALAALFPDFLCQAKIVPALPEHMPACAALEQLVFRPPASEAKLREKLAGEQCHMHVALLGGEVAGFIGVDYIAGEAFIDDIAVFPQHHRKGIASALLAHAETQACLRGNMVLHLECREGNAPALALYHKRGYQRVGRRKGFYSSPREDAVLLSRFFL